MHTGSHTCMLCHTAQDSASMQKVKCSHGDFSSQSRSLLSLGQSLWRALTSLSFGHIFKPAFAHIAQLYVSHYLCVCVCVRQRKGLSLVVPSPLADYRGNGGLSDEDGVSPGWGMCRRESKPADLRLFVALMITCFVSVAEKYQRAISDQITTIRARPLLQPYSFNCYLMINNYLGRIWGWGLE